jgi:hypothetical protein
MTMDMLEKVKLCYNREGGAELKRIILLMTLLSVVLFSIGGMDTTYDNHVNIKEKKKLFVWIQEAPAVKF